MPSRLPALAVAVVLAASTLTACGGDHSYCSTLREDKPRLEELAKRTGEKGATGTAALGDTVTTLRGLRDDAPDDLADEWDTLVGALEGLRDAVEESGADASDFAGGRRPAGVTTGQYDAVVRAARELSSTRVQQAGASIEQHAQDVCKVDLGTGLGSANGG